MAHNPSNIEVDPNLGDNSDGDYASSGYNTSTDSLSSSVNEYVFENGRRYHSYYGADKNLMPTDEVEKDRLDLHHEIILRLMKGKLHQSPLDRPQRILDIGCGTGIWAIDAADHYPSAEVIGVDLSPIQTTWVPPNCKFVVDDAELDWTYAPESFDFIHIRNVSQGISNWPKVLADAVRCLKPGGWLELSETGVEFYCDDGTMKDDNAGKRFCELLVKAMEIAGKPPIRKGMLDQRLEDAGFSGITSTYYKQPWGPWPKEKSLKEVGMMILLMGETTFSAYGMAALTRVLGMTTEEATDLCERAYASTKDKRNHMYSHHYVAYAQKPE